MTTRIFIAALAAAPFCHAGTLTDYYSVEDIASPPGVDAQVGGLSVSPSGKLFACFHKGEVRVLDPESKTWSAFADGLHEPLGIYAAGDSEVLVMQRPELTRLRDEDGDGAADVFQTVWDGFGMTGNYHEFAFGPAVDAAGNCWVGLNVASNGASVREEVRGAWNDIGVPRDDFYKNWGKVKGAAGRMYARVPWRGWVVKIDPRTGTAEPWAAGFRSPNGLGFDAAGNLYVTDNQGDWVGTSKLHAVKKGGFYGHAASLIWRDGWTENPLKVGAKELDKIREPAAVLFPQGAMANSPTQPLAIPPGVFGPFAGQLLVGEMNQARIMRVDLEEVGGTMQGMCIPFLDGAPLNRGNNRLAFGKDGSLWVGQTHLSWVGATGIQHIAATGKVPMEILHMKARRDGFEIEFTHPADPAAAADPANYAFQRYRYEYHEAYGSPQKDKAKLAPKNVALSSDGKRVAISLEEDIKEGFVYELTVGKTLQSKDGDALLNRLAFYNVKRAPVK
ncbi:MAG: hypothetical protein R3F11_10570 [Verrucomicrobiales bacterium]